MHVAFTHRPHFACISDLRPGTSIYFQRVSDLRPLVHISRLRPLVLIGTGCVHRLLFRRAHFTLRCARRWHPRRSLVNLRCAPRWRQPQPLVVAEAANGADPTLSTRTDVNRGTLRTRDTLELLTAVGEAMVLEGGAAAVARTIGS